MRTRVAGTSRARLSLLLWLDGGPVDPLGELDRSELDEGAALDRPVLALLEREPVHRPFVRVDDQDLVDVMGGEERELLPALIARRHDLYHQSGGRMPHRGSAGAVQPAVGHAEVLFVLAQVEIMHGRLETDCAGSRPKQLGELLSDTRVCVTGRGNHVQLTLPDLVEAVEPGARPPLHQLIKACRGRVENHRAHRQEAYRPAPWRRSPDDGSLDR